MIRKAWAIHAGQQFGSDAAEQGAGFSLKLGTSLISGELKSKSDTGEPIPLKEMLFQASPRLTGGRALSNHLRYSYALAFEALVAMQSTEVGGTQPGSLQANLSSEQRLAYLGSDLEAYVGVHSDASIVPSDMRGMLPFGAYPDLVAVEGGIRFKGKRLTVDGDLLFGRKGWSEDADVAEAKLGAMVDKQYFINMKGRMVAPHTFLVDPERKLTAEAGVQRGPYAVSLYGYSEKESSDPKHVPVQGIGLNLRIIVP
jgi:hypothetical protein